MTILEFQLNVNLNYIVALFPWTVSIQNSEGKHLCTGFILSLDDGQGSSWVGTAPSCLIDFDDSNEGNQGWRNWLVVFVLNLEFRYLR